VVLVVTGLGPWLDPGPVSVLLLFSSPHADLRWRQRRCAVRHARFVSVFDRDHFLLLAGLMECALSGVKNKHRVVPKTGS